MPLLLFTACAVRIVPPGHRPAEPRPSPECPDGKCPYQGVAPLDLPEPLRAANYKGGSCYWAAMESVLRWQGLDAQADWWRAHYAGGAYTEEVMEAADAAGWKFAATVSGDPAFLEWCSETRRGAAITFYQAHAVTFCGFVESPAGPAAVLLDNNDTANLRYEPKGAFLRRWKDQYGGGAVTVVYSPSPPRPWVVR